MLSSILNFYTKQVLFRPVIVLLVLSGMFFYFWLNVKDFRLDASADSLILENDEDFKSFLSVNKTYGSNSYLVITYKPKGDIFAPDTLKNLGLLRDELLAMGRVASVFTILDVPLLKNPPVPMTELLPNIKNLEHPKVDIELARSELTNSPIYREILLSKDLTMTALIVTLEDNVDFKKVVSRRRDLKHKLSDNIITQDERSELNQLNSTYRKFKVKLDKEKHSDIAAVREIMNGYRGNDVELFLGGVSMITDDMITFIRNDIRVFGVGILIFLILTLGFIFRKIIWVVLPILCCALSVLTMIGILGIFKWDVTVISSNFISLQLIITMALTIHQIVRYKEIEREHPDWTQKMLVKETVFSKFVPCLYTTLTTIAGFGSLLLCDILPVITFGWMMSVGLIVSLIVTFFLFPAILLLVPKGKLSKETQFGGSFTRLLARITQYNEKAIFIACGLLVVAIAIGVSRLTVENSFIDYFRESTEIYKGMKVIDQELGGTTPLDILLDFPGSKETEAGSPVVTDDDAFDEFDEFDEFEGENNSAQYWFTSDKMALIKKVHDFLDDLPEIGKVLSLETMMEVAEGFNDGKPLNNFQLALLYSQLPDNFKDIVLTPYVSVENSQARISIRIRDSTEGLKRDDLLKKIKFGLENHLGLNGDRVHIAGIMVLYNNMLQSLFSSQIKSMGFVVVSLMLMFMLLFRSVKIALIAIIPNIISAISVLGVMGIAGLPLDMMTITIAAISIGIAVDDTIHYIHRFSDEYRIDNDYVAAMHRCHGSIGNAMYYTSVTIIVGFSILAFSNFIPTILFGCLTGLAMLIALLTALTLLPRLIIVFKPFGK